MDKQMFYDQVMMEKHIEETKKTNVKETSIMAFKDLKKKKALGKMQLLIYNSMSNNKLYTRKQLARLLNLDTSTMSARINELVNSNYILIVGKKICPVSNREVEALALNILI